MEVWGRGGSSRVAGKGGGCAKSEKFVHLGFGRGRGAPNPPRQGAVGARKAEGCQVRLRGRAEADPMNSIAKKNAARINTLLHQKERLKVGGTRVDLNLFVEEMGKTIITNLENNASDICSQVGAR